MANNNVYLEFLEQKKYYDSIFANLNSFRSAQQIRPNSKKSSTKQMAYAEKRLIDTLGEDATKELISDFYSYLKNKEDAKND